MFSVYRTIKKIFLKHFLDKEKLSLYFYKTVYYAQKHFYTRQSDTMIVCPDKHSRIFFVSQHLSSKQTYFD